MDGLQAAFREGARIAIVGGGYIGLEVAAVGAKRGLHVTVFETADRLMPRTVSKPVLGFLRRRAPQGGHHPQIQHARQRLRGNGQN